MCYPILHKCPVWLHMADCKKNIANCKLQNSLYLITFKTLGIKDLSQKYMGDKNLSSKEGGGCAWVHWHCILGIWETANIWYFDIVFWGFEMIDHRGGVGLSLLTLYFGDLGNCKFLVFWHCILGIWGYRSERGGGLGFLGICGILGIWETANLWSFDFVFWGFEAIDQRGGLGFLGIWETANLWYFDFVFWGLGKLS